METNLNRYQAFAIHLLISSLILGAFLSFVYFVWYPQPFFVVEGLEQIVWVLISVDIVLGPALTLVVFNTDKPELKRDLSIIALIQIIGFAYGAHTMYTERPFFAVMYDSDYFNVISASELEKYQDLDTSLNPAFFGSPTFVYAKAPKKMQELSLILEDMKQGGASIGQNPKYFKPLKGLINKKFKFSIRLDELQKSPPNNDAISGFKAEYGERIKNFAYFPVTGKLTSRILVIDKESESVIDYIDINPTFQPN